MSSSSKTTPVDPFAVLRPPRSSGSYTFQKHYDCHFAPPRLVHVTLPNERLDAERDFRLSHLVVWVTQDDLELSASALLRKMLEESNTRPVLPPSTLPATVAPPVYRSFGKAIVPIGMMWTTTDICFAIPRACFVAYCIPNGAVTLGTILCSPCIMGDNTILGRVADTHTHAWLVCQVISSHPPLRQKIMIKVPRQHVGFQNPKGWRDMDIPWWLAALGWFNQQS
ncbi:hypothetical protein C8R43DRAFT_959922 [Mycena crocata]|nr:hypothetical protein C8R43DRAFT_959922 [Mycena crocata]